MNNVNFRNTFCVWLEPGSKPVHLQSVEFGLWCMPTRFKLCQLQSAHIAFMNRSFEGNPLRSKKIETVVNGLCDVKQGNGSTKSHGQCSVFSFHSGSCNAELEFGAPNDGTSHNLNNVTSSRLDRIRISAFFSSPTSGKICIHININLIEISRSGLLGAEHETTLASCL